jgi:hypothetical protein
VSPNSSRSDKPSALPRRPLLFQNPHRHTTVPTTKQVPLRFSQGIQSSMRELPPVPRRKRSGAISRLAPPIRLSEVQTNVNGWILQQKEPGSTQVLHLPPSIEEPDHTVS